jgi:PAS domain S-box-containing protein
MRAPRKNAAPLRSAPEREVEAAAVERPPLDGELASSEERLRREEERFAFALEAAAMVAWDWDPFTDELRHSSNAGRILGLPASTAIRSGNELFALVHPEDRERMSAALRAAADQGTLYDEEFRLARADGSAIWIAGKGRAMASRAGLPGCMSGVLIEITGRKQAEEQIHGLNATLRRRAEELQATLDVLPVGIFIADNRMCSSIRANRAGAAMLGIFPEGNASKSAPDGERLPFRVLRDGIEVPAEDLPMQRAARTGMALCGEEYDIVRADGTAIRLFEYAVPLFDEDGTIRGCMGAFVDITARVGAEQALQNSEARFRGLVENLPAITYLADSDDPVRVLYVSPQSEALLGVPPAYFQAHPRVRGELIHPDDRERVLALCQQATRQRAPFSTEYRMVARDGRVLWIRDVGRWLSDEQGRCIGFQGVMLDITDRKRADEDVQMLNNALRQRLEELQAIIDGSPVGIAVAEDAECRKIRANRALSELLQLPEGANASLSAPPGELPPYKICQDGREVLVDELPMQKCMAYGVPVDSTEFQMVRPDGTVKTIINSVRPLFDASGKVRGCISICTDITERKISEEMRKEADRRKDEFLATLAHELRNPLAPIRSAVELLREKAPAVPELMWVQDVISRQLQQLSRLVDDLLDVSRITRGKIELRKERVALSTVVEHALETSWPLVHASRHTLRVRLPPEPLWLDADPTRLAQVLSNLLNNAAKYTPPGGSIVLTAEPAGDDVVLTIQDNGAGIPPEMLSRIFDMFTQVDTSLERAQGGLGIGLTIVKRLVEMHGGAIAARSEGLGRGSEFAIRLPFVEAPERRDDATPLGEHATPRSAPSCRVLIADDNHDAADTLAMLLEMNGNDVRTAYDGQDALRAAEEHRPDVILLDIGMPGMNGYDVARRLRERHETRGAVLVAMTGWGQEKDRRRSREAGFDHHLVKPVDLDALDALLRRLGSRARQSEQAR